MLVKEFLCSRNDVSLDRNSSRLPHITFICCSKVYTQLSRMCQTTKTKNDVSSYQPNFGTNSMWASRKCTAPPLCSVLVWRIVISYYESNFEYFGGVRIATSRFFCAINLKWRILCKFGTVDNVPNTKKQGEMRPAAINYIIMYPKHITVAHLHSPPKILTRE